MELKGQVVDIINEGNKDISIDELNYMHTKKTGELIRAAVVSGAILAGANEDDIKILSDYGYKLGLAFQIKDDILSEEGNPDVTGKPVGNDKEHNKCTYVSVFGIEGAKKDTAMDNFPAMRVALESGKIDGYVSERPEGVSATAANDNFAMVEFDKGQGFKTSAEDTAIAVGLKKDSDLKDKINKILAGISEDERKDLMDQAIKDQPASEDN